MVTGRDDSLRLAVVLAGHRGDEEFARAHLHDADPTVRAAAVSALSRMERLTAADVLTALDDPAPSVRRRAARASAQGALVAAWPPDWPDLRTRLIARLSDPEPLVVEMSCWALGEREDAAATGVLSTVATEHPDLRCRESAVAALGAIGDPAGLPAVIAALGGRPTLRRRAAVALAGFDGDEADQALRACLQDRDWQVRQVAEALLRD
jgi:HEAT repeat protein